MRSIIVLLLLALLAAAVSVQGSSVDYESDLESAFVELEAELDSLLELDQAPVSPVTPAPAPTPAPVPAPVVPAAVPVPVLEVADPAPVLNTTNPLVKPAIEPSAALAPATEISFRPVEPVLVPYVVPAEFEPLKSVPAGFKNVTIDRRFGRTGPKKRDPNRAKVTFGPTPPTNFTKAAVSKHIYGSSAVVYRRAIDQGGCPCRKPITDNYRYDTEFKLSRRERRLRRQAKYNTTGCACAGSRFNRTREWEARLPVVAQLKKDWNATIAARIAAFQAKVANGTAPCFRGFNATGPVQNVTVTHYHRVRKSPEERAKLRLARLAKLGCVNATALNITNTTTPQFKRAPRLPREERKKLREVVLHPVGKMPA